MNQRNWVVTWKDRDGAWHNDIFVPADNPYPTTIEVSKAKDPKKAAIIYAKKLLDWGLDSVSFHEMGYD